jgi:hypothetical protein
VSLDAVQRSQSSSGHTPVPPSNALRRVGLVGATGSELACVVGLTTLLDADTMPDGSIVLTLNWYVVEGSGWRTHAPCTGGRRTVPGATVDTASSVGTPLTRIS